MATGGAWQSETFDNGRDFEKERAPPAHATQAPPMGAATPTPAMYNSSVGTSRDSSAFGVIALCLRIAQVVFTLVAFGIMAANKETLYASDYSAVTVMFSDVKAFIAVLAMNCIVCLYALVQLVQCFVNKSTKGSFLSSATTGFAMLTFIFDTVLAYVLIAVSAAGADAAVVLPDFISSFTEFFNKANASVAMSFLAFALLAVSAALWPVRLLKLTKGL